MKSSLQCSGISPHHCHQSQYPIDHCLSDLHRQWSDWPVLMNSRPSARIHRQRQARPSRSKQHYRPLKEVQCRRSGAIDTSKLGINVVKVADDNVIQSITVKITKSHHICIYRRRNKIPLTCNLKWCRLRKLNHVSLLDSKDIGKPIAIYVLNCQIFVNIADIDKAHSKVRAFAKVWLPRFW